MYSTLRLIHSRSSYTLCLLFMLLSCHIPLGLQNYLFPSGFLTKSCNNLSVLWKQHVQIISTIYFHFNKKNDLMTFSTTLLFVWFPLLHGVYSFGYPNIMFGIPVTLHSVGVGAGFIRVLKQKSRMWPQVIPLSNARYSISSSTAIFCQWFPFLIQLQLWQKVTYILALCQTWLHQIVCSSLKPASTLFLYYKH
jgi:hypothetical protein